MTAEDFGLDEAGAAGGTRNMAPSPGGGEASLLQVESIAAEVAAPAAGAVDEHSRFPEEAVRALREARLLAAAIPLELGGLGWTVPDLARMCSTLAKACASTGMIAAMHHLQILTLIRHGGDSDYFPAFIQRAAERQWLVASATSEVGATDIGTSIAPLSPVGDGFRLEKQIATLSYGERADAVLITARRTAESAPSDQVFALVPRDSCRLEQRGQWDMLGMRGTCSPSFAMSADIGAEQLLPAPAPRIIRDTLAPLAHVLWSAVWLGIAEAAKEKAHALARARAEREPDYAPARDAGLADAIAKLHLLRSSVAAAATAFPPSGAGDAGPSAAEMVRYGMLKVSSSELAVSICIQCLLASGMAAYSNGSPYSIGRHLRDALSAPIMIANERLVAGVAAYLMVCPPEAS